MFKIYNIDSKSLNDLVVVMIKVMKGKIVI